MLVDDHTILRDGLKTMISVESDLDVIAEAKSGDEALQILSSLDPDVIVMDINIPQKNGIEVTAEIKKNDPTAKVLILTMHSHDEYFMAAIQKGADGYLLKDAPSEEVLHAIRTIAKGESVIPPSMTKKLLNFHNEQQNTDYHIAFTNREKEVLHCIVEALSNKEIAERLYISDKTVKIHVSNIFKKVNVKSRSQLIIYAVQHQLVPLP